MDKLEVWVVCSFGKIVRVVDMSSVLNCPLGATKVLTVRSTLNAFSSIKPSNPLELLR